MRLSRCHAYERVASGANFERLSSQDEAVMTKVVVVR
jgi:hypothetical protein